MCSQAYCLVLTAQEKFTIYQEVAERKKPMDQQHVLNAKRLTGGIFDFMEYKKKKPFFPKPFKLRLGSPINETFYMTKNIVYMEKQILILTKEPESEDRILGEAK